MSATTLIFVIVIGIFAYRGYRQGALLAFLGVLGLLAAYWGAFTWAPVIAKELQLNMSLQGLLPLVVASVLIFIAISLVFKSVSSVLLVVGELIWHVFTENETEGEEDASGEVAGEKLPSLLSRSGGSLVGALMGSVFALGAVYVYGLAVPVFDMLAAPNESNRLASTDNSLVSRWANSAVSMLSEQAMIAADMDPILAKVSAAVMAKPVVTAQSVQRLSHSEELQALFVDPEQHQLLLEGNVEAVLSLPAFQQLAQSEDVQQLAEITGISADLPPEQYQQQLAAKMTQAARKIERMRDDPRLQNIITSPEFQQQMRAGDPMLLLNNPELKELATILLGE